MSDIKPTPYSWRDPKTIPTRAGEIRNLNKRIEAQAAEIERLREALVTVRARIEDIDNPFEDGTRQEHTAFEKAVDAAQLIAMEALEETLHVPETCKENGETFT